jgi:hypothetical protein
LPTTALATPSSEKPLLAFTTPARTTAMSRISPTYSTVPWPRSRAWAVSAAVWARAISS